MNILKKVHQTFSTKKDIDIVISYIKASLKFNLDCARFQQATKMEIHSDDKLLNQSEQLINLVIKDIEEIKKFTNAAKESLKKTKNSGSELSPDEIFTIDMSAIRDIKKVGLTRKLSDDERKLIKSATNRFNQVYAEQIKGLKSKD
ncbi:MAG TPA: hypothetical protein PKJ33_00615 [Alphaproteobacteria bacterium]|nr:hypothetical protein [Alphaproteobacteria bacterium]